jgi:hypothetical protein
MSYKLVKKNNNSKYFIYWIIIIIFLFIIFNKFNYNNSEYFDINKEKKHLKNISTSKYNHSNITKAKTYNLGVCSKNCCATQWPVPIDITEKSKIDQKLIGEKYFRSNMTCNNGIINTGCVCLSKKSKELLDNRGYVKDLPIKNGLLDEDNRKSVFKDIEDKKFIFGKTDELTGKYKSKIILGNSNNILNNYRSIKSEKELAKQYSMPINNNIISFDNQAINQSLFSSNISNNIL